MIDPIFIVGPHRSGSTLWHNLVSMCPGILRLTEPRFLAPPRHKGFDFFLKTQGGDLTIDSDVDKMVELSFSRKGLPGLEGAFWRFEGMAAAAESLALRQAIADRIKASDRTLAAIARCYLDEITRFFDCERACVKFPADITHIPQLISWFPNCRIMHITRDPRALAMSKTNDPAGTAIRILEHPHLAWFIRRLALFLVIRQYQRSSKLHVRFRGLPNYRLFRYEDLLADPEGTAKTLCAFADLEYTPDMLDLEKSKHEHQPSSLTARRQKTFDPASAQRWMSRMSLFDRFLVTALTRRSMRRMDYDPSRHPVFRQRAPASSVILG